MSGDTAINKGVGESMGPKVGEGELSQSVKNIGPVRTPNKSDIYELYVLWYSLPAFFKRPPKNKQGVRPSPREFVEDMGVDDPVILDLVELPFQQDFAKAYDVARETLSDWNKLIEKRDVISDVKVWGKKIMKNVLAAMYSNALSTRNLNADRDRLNFAKIMGWEEKSEVTHRVIGLVDELKNQIHERESTKLPSGDKA